MSDFRDRYHLFWGDLHNHNAVGYAKGSLERSIDIAREHLDFFAFTGHASWHDMPVMPKDRHMHWVNGFRAHTDHWPRTREMIAQATDGDFLAFLGYEWHSSGFGDYCLIFPGDREELFLPDDVDTLLDFAEAKGALAIPHHVAYQEGWRGANWRHFRPSVTPVVEIFSEQGCTLGDRAPYPMVLHSNGGRVTAQTVGYQLDHGRRFGFVASTDDHFGYPGAYGEGVVGVWAEELTKEAIFEALRARRTVAVTGDRVRLGFSVNGAPMGSEIPATPERSFDVEVDAPDAIESVELSRNDRTIRRHFPQDDIEALGGLPDRVRCRFQYGWGPWSAIDLERVCQWDMTLEIEGGRLVGFEKCFQSGPFGEEIVDTARRSGENRIDLRSFTSRKQAFLQDPTKALVLDIDAGENAAVVLHIRRPVSERRRIALADLVEGNHVSFTGPFTSESLQLHRLVFPRESRCRVRWEDARPADAGPDRYELRVRLFNGHFAWASPVWVG